MAKKRTTDRSPTSTSPDPVERYARAVGAAPALAGPLVRLACARHLRDRQEGERRGLRWDRAAAERAIGFFPDVLRLAEGEHAGRPFLLQPWQQFIVGSLFGWKGPDGFRRFRNAYIEVGKGNGKSPLAAGIGLYMLTADGEAGAECYAAATTRDQAGILFRDAAHMVEASPALSARIQKSGQRAVFNLAHLSSGSFFRPVSSEGRGLDGKRVHYAALDEVHEHPSAVVVDKMRAGTKGRRQALIVEITNAGFDRETVCYQHHEYSKRVLEGQAQNDQWFAFVCGLDAGDDWRDESVWPKANPNLDVSIPRKYLREQVAEALGMPAKQNIVRRLNFCEWTEAASAWIGRELWDAVQAPLELRGMRGRRCWGGLDLSGKRDLTALSLVFEPGEDGVWDAFTWLWTPAETLTERAERDRAPYEVWRQQGFLEATPGRTVDYAFVARRIAALGDELEIAAIAFDTYRIDDLKAELDEIDCEIALTPHPQGYRKAAESNLWMPGSIGVLEEQIDKAAIRIQRNPVLTWCAASAVVELDAQENKKFSKRKATGRIDGVVSLAMACGLAASAPAPVRGIVDRVGLMVI